MSGGDNGPAKYVLAIDVGTTTVRAHVYDRSTTIISAASERIELLYPKKGHVEINPDNLWQATLNVVQNALKSENKQTTCDVSAAN